MGYCRPPRVATRVRSINFNLTERGDAYSDIKVRTSPRLHGPSGLSRGSRGREREWREHEGI